MIFDKKIYNLIVTKLSSYFPGGVFAHNLPKNFDFKKPTLVLQYKLNNRIRSLDGDSGLSEYEVQLVIISKNTQTNAELSDVIFDTLDGYEDENVLENILVDDLNTSEDDGLYTKTMNYRFLYQS